MASTYTPIATYTVPSAQTNFTFSSIPSTYTDLVIVYSAKSVSGVFDVFMRFNGDTGSNYSNTYLSGSGSAAESGRYSNYSIGIINDYYGSVASTSFNVARINIMNYANTTTYKTTIGRSDRASSGTDAVVGLWRSTAAINSILLVGSQFDVGSTFTLYGIQAA